jgi:hypothetical protein
VPDRPQLKAVTSREEQRLRKAVHGAMAAGWNWGQISRVCLDAMGAGAALQAPPAVRAKRRRRLHVVEP